MPNRVLKALADRTAHPLTGEDQLLFARAYREHYPALFSFVRRRVGSDAEAADLVQESYLRVLRYRQRQDMDTLKALLFQIAANLLTERLRLAHTRHQGQHVALEETLVLVETRPAQERQVAGEQALDRLMAAVEELPRKCQQVFVLHRFHGLTRDAIANRLGVSLKTVEKHLTAAIASCRRKVGGDVP